MNFNYIIKTKIKNKRNLQLIKNISFSFGKNFIMNFPNYIQNLMVRYPFISKKLGIKYFWVFYESNFSFFLNFFKIPFGPFFSFEILFFSLKKEVEHFKKLNKQAKEPILILNNFSNEKKNLYFFENFLKEMFDFRKKEKLKFEKKINVLLIDFIKKEKKLEFRVYCLTRTNLLIPRELRKYSPNSKKILNFEEVKNFKKKNYFGEKIQSLYAKGKKEKFSSLNIIENGPRFTLKKLRNVKLIN